MFLVEPPTFVELEVTDTDPGFAGNTATNATKPATLETGAEIKVPLFINPGDRIRVDTRVGEYLERAKLRNNKIGKRRCRGSVFFVCGCGRSAVHGRQRRKKPRPFHGIRRGVPPRHLLLRKKASPCGDA